MKKYTVGLVVLISSLITLPSWADAGNVLVARQAVKERKAAFVLIQRSFKQMADMAQGKRDFDEALFRVEMQRLASVSSLLPELFPEGSDLGGTGTKAAASVWEKNVEFMQAMNQYITLTRTFSDTNRFTKLEVQQAVGQIGKECKSCHSDFKSN